MFRFALILAAGAMLAHGGTRADAAKGPRVPPGQWAVDYAKEVCVLSRDGIGAEPGIALRTKPFSNEQDLLVYVARTGEKERWVKGRLSIDAQVVGAERWIAIGEPNRARKLIDTRISVDELAKIAAAKSIRLSSDERLDVTVALPMIAKAMAALRACEVDLASRWGVAPAEMVRWAKTAQSETDLRSMFWNPDPRASVMLRTPVRALLDIDAQGAVLSCKIVQSSRVSWVDTRFCETLRTVAKFHPAIDSSGKAVNGKFVTPAITSALIRK